MNVAEAAARRPVRLLLCAFGPFPGVAVNPSETLARALMRMRRPALADVALDLMILPTRWASLPVLDLALERLRPDGVLLMGVARRRRVVNLEALAANAARPAPDAARRHPAGPRLMRGGEPTLATTAALAPLAAALRRHGVPVRRSRDAGRYLCNAAYFHALHAVRGHGPAIPVVFIHLPGRDGRPTGVGPARMARGLSAVLAAFSAQARLLTQRHPIPPMPRDGARTA